MYLKLYDYYSEDSNSIKDYSIKNIYNLAIKAKMKEKGVLNENKSNDTVSKENTILRDKQDYNRFITPEFAKLDIRNIKETKLEEYIIDVLNDAIRKNKKLQKKAYNEHFKHILVLIFDYAVDHEIINENYIRTKNRFMADNFCDLLDYTTKDAEEKVFSKEEIAQMVEEVRIRISSSRYDIYTNGYMFILSSLTGMRVAELCSLRKSDLDFINQRIYVHTQQGLNKNTNEYTLIPHTKNEKHGSKGGRYIPMFDETKALLEELLKKQEELNIHSEWVFTTKEGEWIRKDQYANFLYRLSKKFGYKITNNHAIRKYFNSYVLIPLGISDPDRAKIMGHSTDVNKNNYSFEDRNYCDNARRVHDKENA